MEAVARMAREGLMCFRFRHHEAISSGATALESLLSVVRPDQRTLPDALKHYHPTPAGTTLHALHDLAEQVGVPLRMIRRQPGAPTVTWPPVQPGP